MSYLPKSILEKDGEGEEFASSGCPDKYTGNIKKGLFLTYL